MAIGTGAAQRVEPGVAREASNLSRSVHLAAVRRTAGGGAIRTSGCAKIVKFLTLLLFFGVSSYVPKGGLEETVSPALASQGLRECQFRDPLCVLRAFVVD